MTVPHCGSVGAVDPCESVLGQECVHNLTPHTPTLTVPMMTAGAHLPVLTLGVAILQYMNPNRTGALIADPQLPW